MLHINEIDDDQAGEVAKPQLPGNLLRRLEIGLQCRLFDVSFAGRPARVYVDSD